MDKDKPFHTSHPILTIPKNAIIDGHDSETGFHYHYSRKERLPDSEEPCETPKRGFRSWYKNNRGLAITFLDVLILVILIILFLTVLRPNLSVDAPRGNPYRFELSGLKDDNVVSVRLELRNRDGIPSPSEGALFYFVLLPFSDSTPSRTVLRPIVNELVNEDPDRLIDLTHLFGTTPLDFMIFRDLVPQPEELQDYTLKLINSDKNTDFGQVWVIVVFTTLPPAILSFQP